MKEGTESVLTGLIFLFHVCALYLTFPPHALIDI